MNILVGIFLVASFLLYNVCTQETTTVVYTTAKPSTESIKPIIANKNSKIESHLAAKVGHHQIRANRYPYPNPPPNPPLVRPSAPPPIKSLSESLDATSSESDDQIIPTESPSHFPELMPGMPGSPAAHFPGLAPGQPGLLPIFPWHHPLVHYPPHYPMHYPHPPPPPPFGYQFHHAPPMSSLWHQSSPPSPFLFLRNNSK